MKDRVDRDEVLAKLAAALMQRDSGAPGAGCPDADVVAGYLDRSLDAAELTRFEEHFAACSRCQDVLVGLARVETPGPLARPETSPGALWGWRANWQWLAPAAAVVVAGVVWTLVKPTLAPVAPSTVGLQAPSAETRAGAAAAEGETARLSDAQKRALDQATFAKDAARATGSAQPASRPAAQSKQAAPKPQVPGGKREQPSQAVAAVAENVLAEPPKATRAEPIAIQKAADAVRPAAAPAPVERAAVDTRAGASRADAARRVNAAGAAVPAVIVSSPAETVAWRLGSAGIIERSTDGRRSWEKQESGVSTTLSAGSAPADTVCWVVGERGTVLRTSDGRTWERVSQPAFVDLVSVSARDTMTATVVAADGRRFVTIDGGRTWQVP